MKAYLGSALSRNLALTPENYLICRNAILARTAVHHPQEYKANEIGLPGDDLVDCYRMPAEVFAPSFLASLEGKAVTSGHPPVFLTPENTNAYQRGHIVNVHEGPQLPDGERSVVADLVLTDAGLIDRVRNGSVREISCGYSCDYLPRGDGSYEQRHLVGNHCAIVPDGRAGSSVRIQDSRRPMNVIDTLIHRINRLTDRLERERAEKRKIHTADDDDLIPIPVADHRPAPTYEQQSGREFEAMCKTRLRQPIVAEPAPEKPCRTHDARKADEDYGKMMRQYLGKPIKVHKD